MAYISDRDAAVQHHGARAARSNVIRFLGALTLVLWLGARLGRAESARSPATDPAKVVVTGVDDRRLASFDLMMRKFMARHRVPGAALAVTRNGRLVYARGFGFADLETGEPVKPHAKFRIASVSKPLTAVAVLRLVDQGKLGLDDRVLDRLGPEASGGDGSPSDSRWRRITLREVLQHRGGWDRDVSFDPMFRPIVIARTLRTEPPPGPGQIVRYMLRQRLDFDPGARYAYSNFGYCVLGRVIERATGETYGQAVHRLVLQPLSIAPGTARVGKTLPEGRAPGEVHYYDDKNRTGPAVVGKPIGRTVPEPYGAWYLEAMEAHGGWVATAPALVRFASAFDQPARCKVLSVSGIHTMFARPPGPAGLKPNGQPKDAYCGCGWEVRPIGRNGINTWHTGSLPGTASILVRRFDGLTWAVLFNTRDGLNGEYLADAIDPLVHDAADAVRQWPAQDQFSTTPAD